MDVAVLPQFLGVEQHALVPAGHREADLLHHLLVGEARLQVLHVGAPDVRPVVPRPGAQAVVAGQGVGQHAEVGGALHVVVAAEDVGAAARHAHVAEHQLQGAVGARDRRAVGVLRAAHRPDDGARPVVGHRPGDALQLGRGHAGDVLHRVRVELGHLVHQRLQAVGALVEHALVFPAVLQNDVDQPVDERHVGARADAGVLVGERRRLAEARVDDDHLRPVHLLRRQDVLHGDGVRGADVLADDHDAAAVADVVHRVGHGAVAPHVGQPGHRGGVADARLVVDVVRAPEGGELAQRVGGFVVVVRRTEEHEGVGPVLLADFLQLGDDLAHRLVPRQPPPLPVDALHGMAQTLLADDVLARRGALGAQAAEVDGVLEPRLLAHPHPVLHLAHETAADGAVAADRFDLFQLRKVQCPRVLGGFGLLDQACGHRSGQAAEAGSAQKMAPVEARVEGLRPSRPWCRVMVLPADKLHCPFSSQSDG